MKHITTSAIILLAVSCILQGCSGGFTRQELGVIENADSIMRVLTIEDPADLMVLRAVSSDLSDEALRSKEYAELGELMVATVTHPSQDGVGIAGPQVGLNRRVVAVQRFDKEPVMNAAGKVDHPFEVYPNIRIVWASDSLEAGTEGCLSVPNRRGEVMRSKEIIIEYADLGCLNRLRHPPHAIQGNDMNSREFREKIPTIRDTISGFTAVIFQHEIDHLDGVLYIDRL